MAESFKNYLAIFVSKINVTKKTLIVSSVILPVIGAVAIAAPHLATYYNELGKAPEAVKTAMPYNDITSPNSRTFISAPFQMTKFRPNKDKLV